MTAAEIIAAILATIGELTKLGADVHTGAISPADAEKRIADLHARIAADRATEDAELAALGVKPA